MLNVFICEDDENQRNNFKKIIDNIILIENYDMKIALSVGSPEEFLAKADLEGTTGLYFIDVDLKSSINGIELAREIRKFDSRGFIIFITTHSEMSYLTFLYKVEALDYIIKDDFLDLKDRFYQCIDHSYKKYLGINDSKNKFFTTKINDKIINVELNKILFFETSSTKHKIIIHATDRQVECYGKLKDIENLLDKRFCRCHSSYIVNKDNIREIDMNRRVVYMINGEECLVSVRLLKSLMK